MTILVTDVIMFVFVTKITSAQTDVLVTLLP
jgi:hypothetical protein